MADSSTSLTVAWNVLNKDDANGLITQYRVCYKNASSFEDICNLPVRETMGNVRRITLSNLEKYTDYVVAVQAATKIGFGQIGANKTRRTKEDSKCCILFSFLFDRCYSVQYFGFIIVCYNRVLNNGLIPRMTFPKFLQAEL
jgi:hypothetical protein